ncbi:MAG: response regulator transcription factor [Actinobacteria bacterium]|nr:response regulator transcription factor [Actinomycetota bacterium]
MSSTVRVVIADDHPVVRAGLRGMLEPESDIEVVGEATNGREAVSLVGRLEPEVVLMDLQMPELDGVAATKQIRDRYPETNVLVLTTFDTDADITRAISAGATGYLLKDAPRQDLFQAIRAAARGESVLTPAVASRLMSKMRGPGVQSLSEREIEVLTQVADGNSNKEIAGKLYISEATVKTHLVHIFGKLGVDDRTAAVTVALERGIIRLSG